MRADNVVPWKLSVAIVIAAVLIALAAGICLTQMNWV